MLSAAATVYVIMLSFSIPRVQSYAPELRLFDLSPAGYNQDEAMNLLHSLGDEGRSAYLFPQLALDTVYPALFAISLSLLLIWIYARRFSIQSKIYYSIWLPILAGLFDYAENACILAMLLGYPNISSHLITVASGFTILKSALSTLAFLFLILGSIALLKKRTS